MAGTNAAVELQSVHASGDGEGEDDEEDAADHTNDVLKEMFASSRLLLRLLRRWRDA
jgi:hypothetical protein